jgi:RNA polymerase sigma-70 factor (ECF subfamily)
MGYGRFMETAPNETELLAKSRVGDAIAYNIILVYYQPKIRNYLQGRFKTLMPEDIDDIMQAAFIRSWRRITTFDFRSAFSTWLIRIAHNAAIDFYRKVQRTRGESLETLRESGRFEVAATDANPDKPLEMSEIARLIDKTKQQLSPSHAEVFKLAFEQEKTYEDIARKIKVPVGTVMSRVFYTRKRAAALMREIAPEFAPN